MTRAGSALRGGRPHPLRTIRNRLALLFFLITLVALVGVYLYVVPQLESSLRSEKLHSLVATAKTYSPGLGATVGSTLDEAAVARSVRRAAARSGARVTLLGVRTGAGGIRTYPIADSTGAAPAAGVDLPVAEKTARSGRPVAGTERTGSGRIAEAARPLAVAGRVARVVVYSVPLGDVAANVALVRRRFLAASGIAILFSVLAGYAVAGVLSQRIKRLERAAELVAAGDFSRPIPVESDDELGQLAVAFNDMQAQLAQLDTARKQFIATASHELRTPIFSLGGFAELLADEELDEETRQQFIAQIREQIARMTKLTTELLDLSKLEAGSLDLRSEPVDVGELARSVTAEFVPALDQHDSHLELRVPRRAIEVTCDWERVAQILRILIDNALAHTPTGTHLYVTGRRHDSAVRLAVRDDGPGINRAVLNQIFEPFYTSDDTRGSGLGLAIARELADRMDGELRVESAPGRTVFTFELPT